MGHISFMPAEILHNIFDRLPINLLVKLRYVCKRWNRLISDPDYLKSLGCGRKILLPFVPVDVLYENDTTRSMVTLSSSSSPIPELEGKVVTFAGSCNGIVLLVIQDCRHPLHENTRMVLYNPLTSAKKRVPDDLHSQCNKAGFGHHHVYGFGYGSTPDDVKIVRFRGCEYSNDNRHTCDVFSPKTNSWIMLKNFVENANWLNDVGTFANGSLYWIANSKYNNKGRCKIVALDVNNMVLSDIQLPCAGLLYSHLFMSSLLGTLNGCLCLVATQNWNGRDENGIQLNVWVMKEKGVKKSWLKASNLFQLNLKSEFEYSPPVSILDDGIVLILIESFQELVICDTMKHSHKVINISASSKYFQRIHGIEYVETLVSPSSLFNA